MTQEASSMALALRAARPYVLAAGGRVIEAGWQDLAEALADIDVALAAIRLGEPAGLSRARVLLSPEGPLALLAGLEGWQAVFDTLTIRIEPALAA